MESLNDIVAAIPRCHACRLMSENEANGIGYIPILPKPDARVVFVGRDPSPRTAEVVGMRGGRSAFINEIFAIADKAGVSGESVYVTDLCKCHWRTSVGKPIPGTEHRATKLDLEVARTCMSRWLVNELRALNPRLVVIFGEEVYQHFRPFISHPNPPPRKLSARVDKSIEDAESWFVRSGTLVLAWPEASFQCAPLRHPGNSGRLPKNPPAGDLRWKFHRRATAMVQDLVAQACA